MQQDKIEQARHLYFAQAKTQKEIAQLLDVSEKTIYNWIRRYSWDQMRQAARQAPALISENLCSQIVELQNSIGRREPGLRYATAEESLVMQRLITMLDKMKKYPGLSMNMQVMQTFRSWASTRDKSFTRDLNLYSGLFLQGYAKNGYYPYELEFGMDKINPIDPYYEEGTTDCHPELVEGLPGPVEGLPKEELNCHPDPVEGLPGKEKEQPVNPASNPTQIIECQHTYNVENDLPAPVKTGKISATPSSETSSFPWHKRLFDPKHRPNNGETSSGN